MHLQQIPFYYPMNTSGLIQAATGVGQPQNIMIPSTNSSAGSATPGLPPIHYAGIYAGKFNEMKYLLTMIIFQDPRMYNLYSSAAAAAAANSAGVHAGWQLARSPPQQQQQPSTDQQRAHGNGQNSTPQPAPPTGSSTANGRSTSISGQSGASHNNSGPSFTPQYTINGAMPTAYAYGGPTGWISGAQQVQAIPANMSPQINAAYNIMFDPSQTVPSQQTAYLHRNPYDGTAYFSSTSQPQPPPPSSQQQQQQQQQQPPPQSGLDNAPQGNYTR